MNQLDMQGRTTIVTGGAVGIGLAIAQRLVASGARVSLWDRDASALEASARALAGAHVAAVDVTREDAVATAFAASVGALKRIDALVCSAGITGPNTTVEQYPLDAWKEVTAAAASLVTELARVLAPGGDSRSRESIFCLRF